MGNDLISRCKLFNALAPVQTLGEAYGVIQGMETEDAEYVKYGRWDCSDDMYETAVCSVCGYDTKEPFEWMQEHIVDFRFCPHCGAKVDRGEGGING